MTINIKRIIDVSTTIQPAALGRRDFSRAIVIQKGDGFTDTVRSYSSADEVLDDLGSDSEAYQASIRYFSGGFNGIRPTQLFVGLVNNSGLTSSTQGIFTTGDVSSALSDFQSVTDGEFTIAKDGSSAVAVSAIDFTAATDLNDVAATLQTRVRLAGTIFRNVNVTYDGTNFIFQSDVYGASSTVAIAAVSGGSGTDLTGSTYFDGGTATDGTTGTLADIISDFTNDNSYYHMILSNDWDDQEILEWSSSVQAATRISYLLWALSTASNIADQDVQTDTTTIARTLFDRRASKTVLIYDATNTDYKQASLASYFGIVDFTEARPLGSLAYKQFSGISATTISTAQFDNLLSKNVNFYSAFGEVGRDIAYSGRTSSGEFINDIIAVDFIDYNMTYNIFDLMVRLPRLGYTSEDFGKLNQAIERAYIEALNAGIIAGGTDPDTGEEYLNGYSISIPNPEDITSADKQQGLLRNITTVGLLRGSAIRFVITNTLKI